MLAGGVGLMLYGDAHYPVSAAPKTSPAVVCMSQAAISQQFPGDRENPLTTGVVADVSSLPLETGKIPRYQTEDGIWHEGRMVPPFSQYVFDGRKPVPETESEKIAAYTSIVHAVGEGAVRFAVVAVGTTDQVTNEGYPLCDAVPQVHFSQPAPLADLKHSGIEPHYSTRYN